MNQSARLAVLGFLLAPVALVLAQEDPRDRNAERAAAQAAPASAPVDFSGEWDPLYHEDFPDRLPGPALGDYLGLPINDAARLYAESWDAARLSLPEHQCMVHVAPYIMRGPGAFRIWQERDPDTQQLVAIKLFHGIFQQTRTIWMDGRPHPDETAAHTWMGFSTGTWDGDVLTVRTTHLKQGWIRRNGVPESDRATLTEHFIRHENILTHVGIVTDPAYLTEPLIRTQDFVHDTRLQTIWTWPCDAADEVATRAKGAVPHYLPGANPNLAEFPTKTGVPAAAARGGAATMYPEYRRTLHAVVDPQRPTTVAQIARPTDEGNIQIRSRLVQGNVHVLTSAAGNTLVQVGGQGALIVDTQPASLSQALLAEVERLTRKSIRYIINTDFHANHTGGNERLRRAGSTVYSAAAGMVLGSAPDGATIIAHENVLNRMSAPTGQQSAAPPAAWPTLTYFRGQKDLFFNGESIQVVHQPAAHTDGDSLVYFRRSDVIGAGDLFSLVSYPVIDLTAGGSVQGVIAGLNRILDLAIPQFDDEGGTLVVPGRGRICDEADVAEYRDMVTIIRDRVQNLIRKGYTLEQVKAARPTRDYDPLYGSPPAPADGSVRQATAGRPSQDRGLPSRPPSFAGSFSELRRGRAEALAEAGSSSSAASEGWTTDMFVEAVYTSLIREPRQP